MPLIASSIRFRCTKSSDPASFEQGEDPHTPTGLPWQINMQYILRNSQIQDYLLQAGIMTATQMSQCRRILESPGRKLFSRSTLYRPDQLFLAKFDSFVTQLTATVGDFAGRISLRGIFRDRYPSTESVRTVSKYVYSNPYTGRLALVAFSHKSPVLMSYQVQLLRDSSSRRSQNIQETVPSSFAS